MKKRIALILVVLLLIVTALGLVACDPTAPTSAKITIYIRETQFDNIAGYSNETLFYHINRLCEKNKLPLSYSGSSQFGAYITELGSLKPDPTTGFISIFTSDEKSKDLTEWCKTITKGDKTLFTAGLGASSLKIINGGVYAFEVVTF